MGNMAQINATTVHLQIPLSRSDVVNTKPFLCLLTVHRQYPAAGVVQIRELRTVIQARTSLRDGTLDNAVHY